MVECSESRLYKMEMHEDLMYWFVAWNKLTWAFHAQEHSRIIQSVARFLCSLYSNVTALRSGLCYRKSVCRLSVCNVGAPYSGGWSFRQYFFTAVHLSQPLTSIQNFTEIVPGEPLRQGIKRKRGIKIERFWTYRMLYLINVTRYGLGYN